MIKLRLNSIHCHCMCWVTSISTVHLEMRDSNWSEASYTMTGVSTTSICSRCWKCINEISPITWTYFGFIQLYNINTYRTLKQFTFNEYHLPVFMYLTICSNELSHLCHFQSPYGRKFPCFIIQKLSEFFYSFAKYSIIEKKWPVKYLEVIWLFAAVILAMSAALAVIDIFLSHLYKRYLKFLMYIQLLAKKSLICYIIGGTCRILHA